VAEGKAARNYEKRERKKQLKESRGREDGVDIRLRPREIELRTEVSRKRRCVRRKGVSRY